MTSSPTQWPAPRGWHGYAVAVVCAVAVVLGREALRPILPTAYPFITLFVGVYMATWFGGLGPGLTALTLGTLGVWYFLLSPQVGFAAPSRDTIIALGINVFNNLLLVGLGTAQHMARRRTERFAREAERQGQAAAASAQLAADRVVALEVEMARREAAERTLGAVLEGTPDAYIAFDREWRISYMNQQAASMLRGYGVEAPALSGQALHGHTMWELWPDLLGTRAEQEYRRVMADRAPRSFEQWYPAHARWLEIHAYATPDGMAVFFRDVTERRRAEEQLQQSQRMDAVGQLAGGVAHEVNNQMTVVLGSADFLLRRSDLPEGFRADLDQIELAARRSATITAQLLAFGRRQLLRPEELALNTIVTEMETILSRTLGPRIELQLALAPDLAGATADRGQLGQALLNLILNARDAMPDGGLLRIHTANVEVRAGNSIDGGQEAVPGPYVTLSVSDTGVGMDELTLRRAFEPFFTTKPTGQGTGLGLSTVYGLVRQSGGYVTAESTRRAGAKLTIYLPRSIGIRAGVTGAPAPSAAAPGVAVAERHSRGVAIVAEDEMLVRSLVTRVLTEEGFRVVEAGQGAEALAHLEAGLGGDLCLLVTDLAMPVMGGAELATRLVGRGLTVPVLFLSGHPDGDVVRQGLSAGHEFLQKPFSPDALAAHVQRLMGPTPPALPGVGIHPATPAPPDRTPASA
jgi:PAS domain S-box-containing protein